MQRSSVRLDQRQEISHGARQRGHGRASATALAHVEWPVVRGIVPGVLGGVDVPPAAVRPVFMPVRRVPHHDRPASLGVARGFDRRSTAENAAKLQLFPVWNVRCAVSVHVLRGVGPGLSADVPCVLCRTRRHLCHWILHRDTPHARHVSTRDGCFRWSTGDEVS